MDQGSSVIAEEVAVIIPEGEEEFEGAAGRASWRQPGYQAYQILHAGFTVAPLVAGLDKFFNRLVNWDQYLHPEVARRSPGGARGFMRLVGVIEISAGILTAVRPRIGGYVVGGWLLGIVGNLLTQRRYLDIALRDFGLALGAISLGRLGDQYRTD